MPTVKELQERRAPIGAEIRKMADTLTGDKKDFTPEERSKWDQLNKDFDAFAPQIEVARKAEDVDAALKASRSDAPGLEDTDPREKRRKDKADPDRGPSEEARALALQAWVRHGRGLDLTPEHRAACKRTGLNPNRKALEFRLHRRPQFGPKEGRAQSASTAGLGGYTVPEGFVYNLEKALKDFNGVRALADVMRTEDGATMPWPTADDTTNTGELIGENTEVAGQDVTFGVVNFGAYKFSSKMVVLPSELLDDDSAFELSTELSAILGERLGRVGEVYNTTGSGTSQPQGVVTAATLGKTAASATAITADEIIDLLHSIDPAYRRDPSFGVMMHDAVLAYVRKLKDGQGQYLFQAATDGGSDRVHGAKVAINQNMASSVATAAKTILAGAFKKFKIRDVKSVRIKRLDERYADKDQVAFIGFARSDSRLLDAGTHPIKYLVQA